MDHLLRSKSYLGPSKKKDGYSDGLDNYSSTFHFPHELPSVKVKYPVLTPRGHLIANWQNIIAEANEKRESIVNNIKSNTKSYIKSPFLHTECEYMQKNIFPTLLPALESTLVKCRKWNAFSDAKCFFNGIDHIVQELWNNNSRYPERQAEQLHVFNMPWVRSFLIEHPRPYYPKSWLWPEEYAAIIIQKHVRKFLVQKDKEVQEMRDFWRKFAIEKVTPEIQLNPLLAKKFAE